MSKLKVAAYCRVSSDHEEQESSLIVQKAYYEKYIQNNKDWILVDIYAERMSGLRLEDRTEFQRMLGECEKRKIDLILTKSISRFGRNTLDTLKILYKLFNMGIIVEFEKEHLNNFDKELRIYISIYAAFAQDESKNMSENIKWGIRERMKSCKVCLNCTRFLGYDKDVGGNLIVIEDEAKVVRKIFELYLCGFGVRKIKKYLEENKIKTVTGKDTWSTSTIDRMLSNEKYVGDVLMQKSFTENFLTGKRKKNNNELDMYFIKNNHEAIISREVFEEVQKRKDHKSTGVY